MEKQGELHHFISGEGLNGTIVNRTWYLINGKSVEV